MGLASFERRLERLVEGAFAKAFRSGLQPVEVGRRLTREMDLKRTMAPKGTLAPNHYDVYLSAADRDRFLPIEDELISELISVARDHARSEGYVFLGPVSITLDADDELTPGVMRVEGEMVRANRSQDRPEPAERQPARVPAPASAPAPGGGATRGLLVLPDGREVELGAGPAVIGRMPGCEVVLADPNASRRHAEVRPSGGAFTVSDLGSTNGTRVNNVRLSAPQTLQPGDQIRVGATSIRFEVG